jgi:ABC-type Mn2+/Zn2+ transport system permease subunit
MHSLSWIIEYQFARHALVSGAAIATLCSLLSVIVVLKRMAFIGEGLSHAGFGGIGTAVFLGLVGWNQDLLVLGFCVAMAVVIGVLTRRRHLEPDSAIGIVLVAAMAWGILISDLRRQVQGTGWYVHLFGAPAAPPNLETLLFGSLISIGESDMIMSLIVAAVVLVLLALFFKEIVFFCFDEEVSKVYGVRTTLIHYILLLALAVTVVLTIRLAGFVLVSAMLVIPGATALLLSKRLLPALLLSWVIGMTGTLAGILLSLELGDISLGACVVGMLCLLFGIVFCGVGLRGTRGTGVPPVLVARE